MPGDYLLPLEVTTSRKVALVADIQPELPFPAFIADPSQGS